MPNWVCCTLSVTGDTDTVTDFVKKAEGFDREYSDSVEKRALIRVFQDEQPEKKLELLCFHALVPVPGKILKAGFDRRGYDWEIRNWGCKWGALNIRRKLSPMAKGSKAEYKFKTPNSSPCILLDNVAAKYRALKFVLKLRYEGDKEITTVKWVNGVRC